MKYLKYILGSLGVIILLFFALGFIVPTISYENTVEVHKLPTESWSVMQDDSKLAKWLTGYKKTELISGNKGQKGAVSNIYFDQNGEEMVIKETITEVVPNKKMAMNFSMDFMTMDYELVMNEKEGKTFITSKSEVKGNSMLSKSICALMKSGMVSQEDENLSKLKKVIEENTDSY